MTGRMDRVAAVAFQLALLNMLTGLAPFIPDILRLPAALLAGWLTVGIAHRTANQPAPECDCPCRRHSDSFGAD